MPEGVQRPPRGLACPAGGHGGGGPFRARAGFAREEEPEEEPGGRGAGRRPPGREEADQLGARRARRGSSSQTSVCGVRPAAQRRAPPLPAALLAPGLAPMGPEGTREPLAAQPASRRRDPQPRRPRQLSAGAADSARLPGAAARGRRASSARAVAEPAPDRITCLVSPPLGGVAGAASCLPVSIALSWGGSAAGRKD